MNYDFESRHLINDFFLFINGNKVPATESTVCHFVYLTRD